MTRRNFTVKTPPLTWATLLWYLLLHWTAPERTQWQVPTTGCLALHWMHLLTHTHTHTREALPLPPPPSRKEYITGYRSRLQSPIERENSATPRWDPEWEKKQRNNNKKKERSPSSINNATTINHHHHHQAVLAPPPPPPWRPLPEELGHGHGDGDGFRGSQQDAVGVQQQQRQEVHQLRRAEERRGAVLEAGCPLLQLQDHDHRQPLHPGMRDHHQVQGCGSVITTALPGCFAGWSCYERNWRSGYLRCKSWFLFFFVFLLPSLLFFLLLYVLHLLNHCRWFMDDLHVPRSYEYVYVRSGCKL